MVNLYDLNKLSMYVEVREKKSDMVWFFWLYVLLWSFIFIFRAQEFSVLSRCQVQNVVSTIRNAPYEKVNMSITTSVKFMCARKNTVPQHEKCNNFLFRRCCCCYFTKWSMACEWFQYLFFFFSFIFDQIVYGAIDPYTNTSNK